MGDYERGLARPERHSRQYVEQNAMIMTIDLDDSEPKCRYLLIKRIKIISFTNGRPLLQPVAIHDDCEPIQLVMRCGHHGLPVAALLQLAIPHQHVRAPSGDVQLGRQRVTDRDGQSVTQRPGVGLDTADVVAVGMAVELGEWLQECSQLLYRQESERGQRGVQRAGNVALGQDETVTLGVIDGLGSDVEHGAVQRRENVDGREVAPDVTGARVMDQLQILDADLSCRLRKVCDLFVAMRMWLKPVEDRHGDVLRSEGSHAFKSWGSVLRAMELNKTSWTSRWAASAS